MGHTHPLSAAPGSSSDPAVAEVLDAFQELVVAQRRLRGRDSCRPGELSFAQVRLLAALEEGEGSPAGRLAAQAGVSPATVTGMLDTLEHMGIVSRVRSESDRRVVLTRLTEDGRRRRDRKRAAARRTFEEALAGLTPEELACAPAVLRRLAGAMEAL